MNKKELDKEKEGLIEELGVQLEHDNLAPVAARILGTLILTGQQGITFDELVSDLKASKSTVSAHLDHLQTSGKVRYFTKAGDRKRYFIINPDLMLNVVDEMIGKWEQEMKMHEKVLQYKKKRNTFNKKENGYQFDLEFQEDYLTFLREASAAIQKLKTKVTKRNT